MLRTTAAIARTPFAMRRPFSSMATLPRERPLSSVSTPLRATTNLLRGQMLIRGAANSVSNKPGSQTVRQAAVNIKEELGNSGADFAKTIAGANWFHDAVAANPKRDTFLGITNAVAHSVPPAYIAFGLFGGLPYLGTGAATIYMAQQAGTALSDFTSRIDPGVAITMLDHALHIQMTYGAVMLSFLGALHCGFEFAGYGGQKGYRRLLLGAFPVVFGWSTLELQPIEALIAQWVGFTWMWWADLRATSAGWTPRWYSQYRFYLTLLAGTCIISTLAATSYWGPVGGHGLVNHDLNMIRALRRKQEPESAGFVAGDVESVLHDGDAYVLVRKRRAPEPENASEQEAAAAE
ncbi:uncharacterized protein C8Q71DRAFT_776717 [Rhodofomes roseus]|uniref:Uncharacterized protein n=1 Tax=Rhodofomes roseus TaxID=34475 RepID=A0ABQ8K668_9APHY|nr:uncharacterized protein C8Q71DRAFT_776717 [Rhodofomes roseus]KAH9832501.1 hypothetical protein C8Q71DRAFT_776717 [Rhodofomes roseus]